MEKINLSEQAKWYLRGNWPIYPNEKPKPEPTAINELIKHGMVIETKNIISYWNLTDFGRVEKSLLK